MADESLSYRNFDEKPTVPARYQTRNTRGGQRRKSTLAKIQKRATIEMEEVQSTELKYKLSTEDSSDDSSVDEEYEVDSIASSISEQLT